MVFVAGLGGEGRFWSRQVALFSRTHHVITYDHGGCGRSSGAPVNGSVESMCDDLILLMELLGVASAVVVGHSTGGAIAQVLAANRPDLVSRVVLSSTWLRADRYMRELFALRLAVMHSLGADSYSTLGRILCYGPFEATCAPAVNGKAIQQSGGAGRSVSLSVLTSRVEALLEFDGTQYAQKVTQPLLIAGARDDMITPAYLWDELALSYPHARRAHLDYGGHFCPQTMTDAYNTFLTEFLVNY